MPEAPVSPIQAAGTAMTNIRLTPEKPLKTAADWVRDMRMSPSVNKTTTGVDTAQVNGELMLATSKRLLGISRGKQDPDPKDSLEFQRFYGPAEYFAEHVLRDGNKLGRNILWKATNVGNLDFMPVNALDKHISDVYYDSKLAQMIDGSSPLETVDASYKTTRIGEGGVGDLESAPDEMRTVQPSFLGFVDPVRCFAAGTELMTSRGWKKVECLTEDDELACYINGRLEYHKPEALHSYDYEGTLYGYKGEHISYLVTPNHRMYTRCYDVKRDGSPCAYNIRDAKWLHKKNRVVDSAMHQPILRNEDQRYFELPQIAPNLKKEQIHGNPPMGANTKNISCVDITLFAEFMGWYLAEGCFTIDEDRGYYRVDITQSPFVNPENYMHIRELIEALPFNATCLPLEDARAHNRKTLSIGRKQLTVYVSQFGKSDTKFIPDWIFNAPLKARLAFRDALLKGDGRNQRHLCTMSKQLAEDFARLQFELGESVKVYHEPEKRYKDHPGIWVVYWHTRRERLLAGKTTKHKDGEYFTEEYTGKVYCPTVPGGLVYSRRLENSVGFWIGNSPESFRVGLDVYMTKNVMKGSDGKLYQKFINAHTGKEELVDSETIAKSVVTTPEMMHSKTKSVFAMGGPTGVRIVPRKDVDYFLPRADEAYSMSSNMVTMPSAVIGMRLLMGCLHPETNVLVADDHNMIHMMPAKYLNANKQRIPGMTSEFKTACYDMRNTVAKLTPKPRWFKKIVTRSGRVLVTSYDHRWPVLINGKMTLVQARDLKPGDTILRSAFRDVPNRRTFLNKHIITKDVAFFLGLLCRSAKSNKRGSVTFRYKCGSDVRIRDAIQYVWGDCKPVIRQYKKDGFYCMTVRCEAIWQYVEDHIGFTDSTRDIPTEILSTYAEIVAEFLNGYTCDETMMGTDSNEDIWVLFIPNMKVRDELSFLFARIGTDTLYRDAPGTDPNHVEIALKISDTSKLWNDMYKDTVKYVWEGPRCPIMVDIDINDNMYAVANGIVTHNSKYPLQAISLDNREAPLVRTLDEASGKDMSSLVGKFLGARFAPQGGVVTAVRKDRIDVIWDDGSKGSVPLYVNFPMNAKGFINNTPVIKAGMPFKKGQILASSNYTDKDGTAALGINLKSGWISWKGGTYEDAVVISEEAAKKLTSTTMYNTSVDLDKTISLGKKNYITWKPAEYTKEQMDQLDDNGVVRPGTVLHKGDPMILAVRTSEPSPGTMGKRILTDLSETWDHDHEGIVTDVVRTRKGVKVFTTVTAPAEIGDKIAGLHGNKGTIAQILPKEQMPQTKQGTPLDICFSPLGVTSRNNTAQLYEALLGKVAKKTGQIQTLPAFFEGDLHDYVEGKLKEAHVHADDDLVDPETGREIPGVLTGFTYVHKLKHLAESKLSARGTGEYSADETPSGGGRTGSKRFGSLETSALVGHQAFETLKDAKILRGQSNADFWRSIRTGSIPVMPGEPLVHKKFFAHLIGSGVNVRKTQKGISAFALSNDDVNELTGPRELRSRDTYEAKNFRPIDGGLFGQDVFGINGDKWGYIKLDEPVPNPVMEEPLARLLRMPDKTFIGVATGKIEYNGIRGPLQLRDALANIDLNKEAKNALIELKNAPTSKKDAMLKRYVAIERMRRAGVSPDKYMLDKIPVLPPQFRPITSHNGLTMVADSNYLYAQLLDARDDVKEARDLPEEFQQQARERLYKDWKELTGLYEPENKAFKAKHIQGLLKWALGDSPKFGAAQRKVISSTVDTVGRGVITPNPRLKLNEVGIPEEMAFGIFSPLIERGLVQRGYTPVEAIKQVNDKSRQAKELLTEVMKTHPVIMNRAPTLHKLSVMAFNPVLVTGHALQINPSIVVPFGADFDGDTVNIHAPMSDNARAEARRRMFPERNLIAMKNRQIAYKPEKEYLQGIYTASRINDKSTIRPILVKDLAEAREAYRKGLINIDDPIDMQS